MFVILFRSGSWLRKCVFRLRIDDFDSIVFKIIVFIGDSCVLYILVFIEKEYLK